MEIVVTIMEYIKAMNPNTLIGIAALSGMFYIFINIFKSITGGITGGIKKISFYNLEVFYANSDYNKFTRWIRDNRNHFYFIRDYKISAVDNGTPRHRDYPVEMTGDDYSSSGNHNSIVPGYGKALLKVPGYPPMIFERSVEKDKKNITDQADIIQFKMLTTNKASLHEFYNMVVTTYKDNKYPELRVSNDDWWSNHGNITKSSPPVAQVAHDIVEDVSKFLASEKWYTDRGLPFKRGYVFHGCPGSGKTQIVKYLAAHFNMDLHVLDIRNAGKNLTELLSGVRPNSIILVEDIDLAGIVKRNVDDEDKSIDAMIMDEMGKSILHGLLNALDGVNSYDKSIFICTTNDISALDSAFLRKGRIDVCKEVDKLTVDEQLAYFNKFYDVNYVNHDGKALTIADLQGVCVNYKYDPHLAGAELGFAADIDESGSPDVTLPEPPTIMLDVPKVMIAYNGTYTAYNNIAEFIRTTMGASEQYPSSQSPESATFTTPSGDITVYTGEYVVRLSDGTFIVSPHDKIHEHYDN